MAGVQNSMPSQQPRSRLRWLSKSIDVPSGTIPCTTPGASIAMRAAIQPPCDVPRTNACGMPSASRTCRLAIAGVPVGELRVRRAGPAVAVRLDGEEVGGRGELLVGELRPVELDGGA